MSRFRLQMGVHRLLQRAFARLYGYKLPPQDSLVQEQEASSDIGRSSLTSSDYESSVLVAHSMADLNYKLKGARFLFWIVDDT